jgi:hypothetical protein
MGLPFSWPLRSVLSIRKDFSAPFSHSLRWPVTANRINTMSTSTNTSMFSHSSLIHSLRCLVAASLHL